MIPALFQVFFAFVIVTVIAFSFEQPWTVAWNFNAVGSVVWLGILGSGFAYLVNFRLLSRMGATRTSLVAYLLPVVGIIAGAIVFRETVDARVIFGTALVIGGVALVNSRYGQRRLFGRSTAGIDTTGAAPRS
jgi:drug/metabolite transporter (DMT)-like permease